MKVAHQSQRVALHWLNLVASFLNLSRFHQAASCLNLLMHKRGSQCPSLRGTPFVVLLAQ